MLSLKTTQKQTSSKKCALLLSFCYFLFLFIHITKKKKFICKKKFFTGQDLGPNCGTKLCLMVTTQPS